MDSLAKANELFILSQKGIIMQNLKKIVQKTWQIIQEIVCLQLSCWCNNEKNRSSSWWFCLVSNKCQKEKSVCEHHLKPLNFLHTSNSKLCSVINCWYTRGVLSSWRYRIHEITSTTITEAEEFSVDGYPVIRFQ